MYHYVYKTINSKNGKYCFGKHSTNNLNDGYQGSSKWVKDCNKSKTPLVTKIIKFFNEEKKAYQFEKELVEKYFNDPLNKNMIAGGLGYQSGKNHLYYGKPMPLEKKIKISLSQKGKPRWTEEQKKKIGEKHKGKKSYWYGKKLPDEIKKKISIANSGENNGMKRFGWKNKGAKNGMYKKDHTPENKKRMSEAAKKYWVEWRLKNKK